MKYAPFPVVGAPAGMALGGGCEVLLHCDAIVAHAETYAGLVEAGVGMVPAWGGCKELLARYSRAGPGGPMPPVSRAFETVSLAKASRSAHEARDLGILRRGDVIVMNRDRVLAEAIDKVHALSPGYAPPEPPVFNLPGPSGKAALALAVGEFARTGKATAHDVVVADALARVLTGGGRRPDRRGRGGGPARAGARGGALLGAHGGDPGAHRAYARYREAVAQLSAGPEGGR